MKPLIFLSLRSFVNGLRRAVTSPRRLISLLSVVGYYFFFFVRPFQPSQPASDFVALSPRLTMPDPAVLDPWVFSFFAGATLLLASNVFGYRGAFRPADVDVLFPTPVSPKIVLVFRLLRDFLLTLLVPLVFAVIGFRPARTGVEVLIRNFPQYGGYVFRAATLSWLLVALAWVSMGYAASLFVNRSDLKSDRNRLILAGGMVTVVLAVALYVSIRLRADLSWDTAGELANSPLLRVVFFTASAATAMVMAPITGSLGSFLLGLFALIGITVVSIKVALTQVGWLYDQAAARGFDAINIRSMQRRGDYYAIYSEQARRGKLKTGRLSRWVARTRPRHGAALLWKDMLLQMRAGFWLYVLMVPLVIALSALPATLMRETLHGVRAQNVVGGMFVAFQALGLFMLVMNNAQTGFIELLRRVDLLKPLPFSPTATVFWESIGKIAPGVLITWLGAVVATVLAPNLLSVAIASAIMMPSVGALSVSVVMLMTVLFPDVDDPTQRGFRNMLILLGILILGAPGGIIVAAALAQSLNLLWVCGLVFLLNVVITLCASVVAGSFYRAYNPSE